MQPPWRLRRGDYRKPNCHNIKKCNGVLRKVRSLALGLRICVHHLLYRRALVRSHKDAVVVQANLAVCGRSLVGQRPRCHCEHAHVHVRVQGVQAICWHGRWPTTRTRRRFGRRWRRRLAQEKVRVLDLIRHEVLRVVERHLYAHQ